MKTDAIIDEDRWMTEATNAFEREVGVTNIPVMRQQIGNREFLKFQVGRDAPLYKHALRRAQNVIASDNPFRGAMGISLTKEEVAFPNSLEANALLTLLTRSTKEVSEDNTGLGYKVPYIPFQKREDHQLAQPASHIVRGRRGVGKSTLIRAAIDLLSDTSALIVVIDMQSYTSLIGDDLLREVTYDICRQLASAGLTLANKINKKLNPEKLLAVAQQISDETLLVSKIPITMKRILAEMTRETGDHAFIFLDDFHLVDNDAQPQLLHSLHGAVKGANGWLKVAGLHSLLNTYSAKTRSGLQVPGDAQFIPLDLTLENPEAAETHLRAILGNFLQAVGHTVSNAVLLDTAFKRLVWATAGVPRDFLQMFARAMEHAQRNRHTTVTLSDVNVAIGEFGQQKMDDLLKDARNEADALKKFLTRLETLCLGDRKGKVNAFLVRSEDSRERELVHALSDLRMVHLIHQSITPNRAGERYEAYIIDYSIFTGFRRRRGVREMIPEVTQFKAADLRALPRIDAGFLGSHEAEEV